MTNYKLKSFYSILFIIILSTCKENPSTKPQLEYESYPKKDVQYDENGDVLNSEIFESDFHSSENCFSCHEEYVKEWGRSMHAYAMKDPIFFNGQCIYYIYYSLVSLLQTVTRIQMVDKEKIFYFIMSNFISYK